MAYTGKKVILKIIILGESGVGKTAILHQYVNRKFIEEHKATIGADFLSKELEFKDKTITLQIWDTAGQERFQSLGNSFYRGADACVFVYDITNDQSFQTIEQWRSNFLKQAAIENEKEFPFLLLGNKYDKQNERQVEQSVGQAYASKFAMDFYETSAMTGRNVEDAVKQIALRASDMETAPYCFDTAEDKIDLNTKEDLGPKPNAQSQGCACNLI